MSHDIIGSKAHSDINSFVRHVRISNQQPLDYTNMYRPLHRLSYSDVIHIYYNTVNLMPNYCYVVCLIGVLAVSKQFVYKQIKTMSPWCFRMGKRLNMLSGC